MMTDTIEVEKWRPVHGGDAWVRVTDYDALAAELAEVTEDRDDALIALASARKQLERYIGEAEAKLPTVYLLGLADAAWAAAGLSSQYVGYMSRVEKGICALPTPTAAELMARIQTGKKDD